MFWIMMYMLLFGGSANPDGALVPSAEAFRDAIDDPVRWYGTSGKPCNGREKVHGVDDLVAYGSRGNFTRPFCHERNP